MNVSLRFHEPTAAVTKVKLLVRFRGRKKKNRSYPSSQRKKSARGTLPAIGPGVRRTPPMARSLRSAGWRGSRSKGMFSDGMNAGSSRKYSTSPRMMPLTGAL